MQSKAQRAVTCLIAWHWSIQDPHSHLSGCYGELLSWPVENPVLSGDLRSNFGLPLRHAEKINSSEAFVLTYVWKALFLVISSNCWVSMVKWLWVRESSNLYHLWRKMPYLSGSWLLWGEDTSSLCYFLNNGWDSVLIEQGRGDKRDPASEPWWSQCSQGQGQT